MRIAIFRMRQDKSYEGHGLLKGLYFHLWALGPFQFGVACVFAGWDFDLS